MPKLSTIDKLDASIQGLKVNQVRTTHEEIQQLQTENITRHTPLSNGMLLGDYALAWIRAHSQAKYKLNNSRANASQAGATT